MTTSQQQVEVAATLATTGGAWFVFLNHFNEVLITISTLIAIAVGLWTLWDKWRVKNDPVAEKLDAIIDKIDEGAE